MSDTSTFHLIRIWIINGKPDTVGKSLLAGFDCTVSGVSIFGMGLVASADGAFSLANAMGTKRNGAHAGASIHDAGLKEVITRAAYAAYVTLGGARANG